MRVLNHTETMTCPVLLWAFVEWPWSHWAGFACYLGDQVLHVEVVVKK